MTQYCLIGHAAFSGFGFKMQSAALRSWLKVFCPAETDSSCSLLLHSCETLQTDPLKRGVKSRVFIFFELILFCKCFDFNEFQ